MGAKIFIQIERCCVQAPAGMERGSPKAASSATQECGGIWQGLAFTGKTEPGHSQACNAGNTSSEAAADLGPGALASMALEVKESCLTVFARQV